MNPRYCLLCHQAYVRQEQIGWENLSRGLISSDWKRIQYLHLLEKETKDIYAVHKWTRMIIRNMLEFHRVMWKQRCELIAEKNKLTYEGRQRHDMHSLCVYLWTHPTELLKKDFHYLDREEHFFTKSPFVNVLMWQRRIETYINNKSPSTINRPESKNSIKRHFRIAKKRKRRGRPKKSAKKKWLVLQQPRQNPEWRFIKALWINFSHSQFYQRTNYIWQWNHPWPISIITTTSLKST